MTKEQIRQKAFDLRTVEGKSIIEIASKTGQSVVQIAEWLAVPRYLEDRSILEEWDKR